jgi:anti-sigma B factor antagonist
MRRLEISERQVDDVSILDMSGTLAEWDDGIVLRQAIQKMLQEHRAKILLNMRGVIYINSPGIGYLIHAGTTARNAGAAPKILGRFTKQVHDLLKLTKLITFFDVFDDEAEAIESFQQKYVRCLCPVCNKIAYPPLPGRGEWQPQACIDCHSKFEIRSDSSSLEKPLLTRLESQSYEYEYVELVVGIPLVVSVVGRLDLFSSAALRRVWSSIPKPFLALIDLSQATKIDVAGRDALFALLECAEEDTKLAISLEGLSPEATTLFSCAAPAYPTKQAALLALGRVSGIFRWPVRTRIW